MKTKRILLIVIAVLAVIWIVASRKSQQQTYQHETGFIFGTIYNITYQSNGSLKSDIEQELRRFDSSLSMFNDTSTISRINRNEDVAQDSLFTNVIKKSLEISNATDGAFDITVAPLVNVWGFGFKKGDFPDSSKVDSLRSLIGYKKISLTEDGNIIKSNPQVMLDCSAIAKGYAVDIIAELLQKKGVENYMVDIGGEVDVKGHNPEGNNWRIGISKPSDDSLSLNQELQTILSISNVGLATSGNYRNFYYKGGKKYAHTIDPKTGYPVQHSILSSTVIAQDCMTADAYATSFMVMGLERAKTLIESHPELEVYFIYTDTDGDYKTYMSDGMKKFVDKN